ncbi:MAG: flagellin, partial [Oscillospiraceae bacterium]
SDIFTAAETSLYYVSGTLYNNVNEKLVSIQSTKGDVEFEAIGNEIMQQAEAMVKALNVDSGGRQLLAGTSNNKEPFTFKYFLTDENGDFLTDPNTGDRIEAGENDTLKNKRAVVYYNDQDVTAHSDKASDFNGSGGIYIDVGYGIKYDSNGNVVPSTAMDIALNGAQYTGCGVDNCDGEGDSNNIIQLTFDAARAAYNGDIETCNRLIDKLSAAQTTMLEGITGLGVKQNNIEFHISKDSDYRVNLQEKQNEVEGVDLAEVITQLEAAQASYNAALRLGSQAVPQSIFNFI